MIYGCVRPVSGRAFEGVSSDAVAVKAGGIQGDRIEVSSVRGDFQAISIESVGGQTSIVCEAVATTADGVLILDLHPGIVMVELGRWLCSGVPDGDPEESSGDHYDY